MSANEHGDGHSPSGIPPEQEDLELPDGDETAELLQAIEVLCERVEEYHDEASVIDDEFRRQNEDRNFGLDDLPYGEELIRISDFPSQLADAQKLLVNIQSSALTNQDAVDSFKRAMEIAQEVESTLDDCTPLPPFE